MKLSKHSFTTICAEINSAYMNYLYLTKLLNFYIYSILHFINTCVSINKYVYVLLIILIN